MLLATVTNTWHYMSIACCPVLLVARQLYHHCLGLRLGCMKCRLIRKNMRFCCITGVVICAKSISAFSILLLASRCGRADFSNCKSFAPPVNVDDIEITQKLVKKCSRIDMTVQWKIPKAGKNVTGVPVPNGK